MRKLTRRERSLLAAADPDVAEHLRHVMAAVPGLTLTSTLRTAQRNRAVGGSPRSLHLTGRAGDLAGRRDALDAGYAFATRHGAPGTHTGPREALIHDKGSGTHLHLAW